MQLDAIRILFFRLLCKIVEWTCRVTTWMRPTGLSAYLNTRCDPTSLLITETTTLQLAAEHLLKTQATWRELKRLLVVIPFRDHWRMTSRCLETLKSQRLDGSFTVHIIVVDNGSTAETTAAGLSNVLSQAWPIGMTIEGIRSDTTYNFSYLNNLAVTTAAAFQPDACFFLNNDVELSDPETLTKFVAFASCCPNMGALSCTLLYPNGYIQHLFAAPGIKLVAAHPLRSQRFRKDLIWVQKPRPVAAVTGAAMLVKMHDFSSAQGFDENLPTLGQDIDLCLKLQKLGLCNWVLSDVTAVHYESVSRGFKLSSAGDKSQIHLMYQRWGRTLTHNPYFSNRLSRWSEQPALSIGEGRYPYHLVI